MVKSQLKDMSNILLVSGHMNLVSSHINREIISNLEHSSLNIKIHTLGWLYNSYFDLDVAKEHEVLRDSDTIILQFPFYWYNMPSIMHLWIERVFTSEFAHQNTFRGRRKSLISSLTTGSARETVDNLGGMEVFLQPIIEKCRLMGMEYKGHVVTYDVRPTTQDIRVLANNHTAQLKDILR